MSGIGASKDVVGERAAGRSSLVNWEVPRAGAPGPGFCPEAQVGVKTVPGLTGPDQAGEQLCPELRWPPASIVVGLRVLAPLKRPMDHSTLC